jgi:hypothetical protein
MTTLTRNKYVEQATNACGCTWLKKEKENGMRRQGIAILAVFLLVPLVSLAQQIKVNADIPFSFLAGGQSLPAGTYQFLLSANGKQISVRNTKGQERVLVTIVTRLSPRGQKGAEIVFDVAGSEHYLSEVFPPGSDGFMITGAPGEHTHVSATGN